MYSYLRAENSSRRKKYKSQNWNSRHGNIRIKDYLPNFHFILKILKTSVLFLLWESSKSYSCECKMASKPAAAKIIKYVGLRTKNFGRPIWEIVLNLKNFGIGRYVIRTTPSERYPEPTFYKILSVQPEVIEYPEKMRGILWTECTFRGRKLNEPVNLGLIGWNDDFQLIHKHEESNLLTLEGKPRYLEPTHILPRTAKLPPLWKEIIRREKLSKGLPVEPNEPDPELDVVYNHRTGFIRVAKEGEEPTIKIGPGHFKTNNSHLYDDVIWNREEAIAKYNNLKPVEPTKGHTKFQLSEEILSGEFLNK